MAPGNAERDPCCVTKPSDVDPALASDLYRRGIAQPCRISARNVRPRWFLVSDVRACQGREPPVGQCYGALVQAMGRAVPSAAVAGQTRRTGRDRWIVDPGGASPPGDRALASPPGPAVLWVTGRPVCAQSSRIPSLSISENESIKSNAYHKPPTTTNSRRLVRRTELKCEHHYSGI